MPQLIVVMGPSGCGKSTLASAYAAGCGARFVEADDHHPAANIAKMAGGQPLTDADRIAWLDALLPALEAGEETRVVLACSALTPFVQSRLRDGAHRAVTFVDCALPEAVLARRLEQRQGHFMPPGLLASQLAALSLPDDALILDADAAPDIVLQRLTALLEHER